MLDMKTDKSYFVSAQKGVAIDNQLVTKSVLAAKC